MEVVGGVASIITLIEATGVLAGVSKDLVLRWRNAPHEIQALATRLSLLAAELQSIKNATARSHPVLTDAIIRQSLSDLLTDARKRLTKLERLHFRLEQHGPVRQKFQWTVKDAGSAEKMLNKTQEVEQRLANLMSLIALRAQTPILDGLERIEQMVSTLVVALPASDSVAPATSSLHSADTTSNISPWAGSEPSTSRATVTSLWKSSKSWERWGFCGLYVTTRQGYHTDRGINFSVSLPLARILGSYALTGCLSLRSTPLCRSSFTFRHPSYFAVARVVDEDHPFMSACRDGDIETVRFMLRSGEGRPTDMTAKGKTPLFFAAVSGNIEVVAELLECGVEVDAIVDSKGMSTMLIISSRNRRLNLVRYLVQQGASVDHLNFGACAACWCGDDLATDHSALDIYNVLDESTYTDLRSEVCHHIMTIACASVAGCGSHIDSLVRLGYDVYQYGLEQMGMIGLAATYGNYSTYSALISHFGGNIFGHVENVFVCLLGCVVLGKELKSFHFPERTAEYDKIVMDLLQRCGDDRLWLLPPSLDADPGLFAIMSYSVDATELATAFSPETELWYLDIVYSSGFLSEDEENEVMRRLRELSSAGHVITGFVYECEEESDQSGDYTGCGHEDCREDSVFAESEGTEHPDTGVNDSCESGIESEADEADQFWDAYESVQ